ncbi:MAG: LysM peptidoglycan-binding domain-containing protein [Desulfobulbaceae bacterium]|nr:LysM peptidoglycan-binding domain-containing protein [Desulfobulbaceae bacterium]HIJ77770.1 LysM peptidoglycan-binding domain-containing protein [Deltaproteobacteria bacterium]
MYRTKGYLNTSSFSPALIFILFSALFLSTTFFWACAPIEPTPLQHAALEPAAESVEAEKNVEIIEEITPPEPEQTESQEIAKLENLGDWEEGKPQEVAPEEEVTYDFPVTMNKQVEFYLDFFQNEQRNSFARWLARSARYMPMVKKRLAEAGLPLDLAYLPLIESGYNLTAYSRAHAAGPWQFIRATGRHYGLKIDEYVDERRDPEKATQAAISYLSNLYEEFGSWQLAVAGYNAGEGKIHRAIKQYKTKNFWELAKGRYLRLETKRYVPKLIAAIMIAKDPEKYGFSSIDAEPILEYEVVGVPRWTSLQAVALACEVELEDIHNLNRELRRAITPPFPATYPLKVPVGKKTLVAQRLPKTRAVVTTKYRNHQVKKGETLSRICKQYNLNKTTLLKANNLSYEQLAIGQHLRIPYQITTYKLLTDTQLAKLNTPAAAPENLVLHKVQPGETVGGLAQRYNVPIHMVAAWNDISDPRRIRAGQQLAFYLQDADNAAEDNQPLTTVALEESTYYLVKGGDSLWSIAQKFESTPEEIKELNQIQGDTIYPGLKLIIRATADIGT